MQPAIDLKKKKKDLLASHVLTRRPSSLNKPQEKRLMYRSSPAALCSTGRQGNIPVP